MPMYRHRLQNEAAVVFCGVVWSPRVVRESELTKVIWPLNDCERGARRPQFELLARFPEFSSWNIRSSTQGDRLIADCMDRIARQREVITTRFEQGLPTDVPESMLRALEESLLALEKHFNTSLIASKTRSRHDKV